MQDTTKNNKLMHYSQLKFLPEYFFNENWHPSSMGIEWPTDELERHISEWQAEDDKVIFNGFRVIWDSSGSEYSNERWPYELHHPFDKETTMEWEDDGFFIENDFGYVRLSKTDNITIGDFITACKLLRIDIEKYLKSDLT